MNRRTIRSFLVFTAIMIFVSGNCIAELGFFKAGEEIKLPAPRHEGKVSVEKAIYERRSIRSFTDDPLTLEETAQLLWAAGGVTVDGVTGPTRAFPSAGATYPLEIYLVAGNITGLESGVYRYDWRKHALIPVKKGDLRSALAQASLGQRMINNAPATIVITALYERTTRRYGARGRERYVSMDAGHVGQNVHLQAQGLGLGTVMVGAFRDNEVARVIDAGKEIPVYIMPVGRPR